LHTSCLNQPFVAPAASVQHRLQLSASRRVHRTCMRSRAPPHMQLRPCGRGQLLELSRLIFIRQRHRAEYTCTSASTNTPPQYNHSRSCSASQSQGLPPHSSCKRSRGLAECPRGHPSRSGERGGGPGNYRSGCCRNIACRSRRRSAGTSSPNRPVSLTAKHAPMPHHADPVPAA